MAFAAIARPEKFYHTLRQHDLNVIKTYDFADHHNFTEAELKHLKQYAEQNNATLITTEKDYTRLAEDFRKNVICLEVKLEFEDKSQRLLADILGNAI